jgi:hypothetical protein
VDDERATTFPEHCSHRHLGIEVVGTTNVLVCQQCLAVVDRDLPVYFKT